MNVYRGLGQAPPTLRGCVLTIGNFDGVHRGHQQIIVQAAMLAAKAHTQVVALTFDPHPLEVVAPDRAPRKLMPLDVRIRCLLAAGCDAIVVARSEPELLALSARDFVESIVVDRFAPRFVVEGMSFGFGRGRAGTPQLLEDLGPQFGFETRIVEPLKMSIEDDAAVAVSSSIVRQLLQTGQVHAAHLCLGRPYALFGVVRRGHARGRELGCPTANLGDIDQIVPGEGVYAGRGVVRGREHPAAISIGTAPTFNDGALQVEAHLLDFAGELYDESIELTFTHYLRSQRRFPSLQELRRQIEADVARVRELGV